MASGAIAAEAMGHHPEWFNVYNRLIVDLTTHDAGGISAKDFELAAKLNALYPQTAIGADSEDKFSENEETLSAEKADTESGGKFSS
jgi:Pterin 4 alpha carbinolamine dehydratase